MRYRVQHAYRADDGRPGTSRARWHLEAGQLIDLTLVDAGWLNRDSPGLLVPEDDHLNGDGHRWEKS